MIFRLIGVIGKICKENEFSLCEPIFIKNVNNNRYYRINENGAVEEVDRGKYGATVFLPAVKDKVEDGNEYFIAYNNEQNHTCKEAKMKYLDRPEVWFKNAVIVNHISVGIKFPDKFVCVREKKRLTANELESYLDE